MSLTASFVLAAALSCLVTGTFFALYVVPAVRRRPLGAALVLLLWPHVFRFVALEIYSAAAMGHISANPATLNLTVFGDVLSAVLALVAIWALSARARGARVLAGVAVTLGSLDIANAVVSSLADGVAGTISDLSWFIFVYLRISGHLITRFTVT